ncbi:MAG: hypothetical protein ACI4SB_10375 [Acutalibacteraceae bacterium]
MKKVISVFLCILMAFSMVQMTVSAEDAFSHVTQSSFDACTNAAAEGTDYALSDEGATVTVNTADGYCKAVSLVNATGSVITKIVLNADLDMDLMEMMSIRLTQNQQRTKMFTLDGNGHTIRQPRITIASNGYYYCGLIATANYATVKDLTVEDAVMGSRYINGSAAILGNCVVKAVFENITVKNSTINGYGKVGAILGLNNDTTADLTFRNIKAENNTVVAVYNAGGIAGLIKRAATLNYSDVTVTGDTFITLDSEANTWETLNTTVTCDGSADSCIGAGEKVHGLYWDYAKSHNDNNYYYFGGYGRYWVIYGKTSHDCSAEGLDGYEIGNSELVVNSLDEHEHTDFTLVTGTAATCVSEGVCDYYVCECGVKLLKGDYPGGYMEFWDDSVLTLPVDTDNHTGNTITQDRVDPTCIANGYSGDVYCEDCGVLIENGTELPALGTEAPENAHTAVKVIPAVDPTCDKPGSTEGKICEDCGAVIVPVEEIPATGNHVDEDADGKCDECGADIYGDCSCICHRNNIFSKIIRYICTLFTKIFHKKITCCPDMKFWKGELKDLT